MSDISFQLMKAYHYWMIVHPLLALVVWLAFAIWAWVENIDRGVYSATVWILVASILFAVLTWMLVIAPITWVLRIFARVQLRHGIRLVIRDNLPTGWSQSTFHPDLHHVAPDAHAAYAIDSFDGAIRVLYPSGESSIMGRKCFRDYRCVNNPRSTTKTKSRRAWFSLLTLITSESVHTKKDHVTLELTIENPSSRLPEQLLIPFHADRHSAEKWNYLLRRTGDLTGRSA